MSNASQVVLITAAVFTVCCSWKEGEMSMNPVAESYVKLVLKVGLYDPDYVDGYYGPEEWRPAKIDRDAAKPFPFEALNQEVSGLIGQLEKLNQEKFGAVEKLGGNFGVSAVQPAIADCRRQRQLWN